MDLYKQFQYGLFNPGPSRQSSAARHRPPHTAHQARALVADGKGHCNYVIYGEAGRPMFGRARTFSRLVKGASSWGLLLMASFIAP
jgi:hypothetical protein